MTQPIKVKREDNTTDAGKDISSDIRHLDNRLTGDIREVRSDIKKLDKKFDNKFETLRGDVKVLDEKFDNKFETLRGEIRYLDDKIGKNLTWAVSILAVGIAILGLLIKVPSFPFVN